MFLFTLYHPAAKINLSCEVDIDPLARVETTQQMLWEPERWQSAEGWLVYNDRGTCPDTKLLEMAKRLRVCGCKKLKEGCFAHAAAVALFQHADINGFQDHVQALDYTPKLKSYFNSLLSISQFCGPDVYPAEPSALSETHRPLWEMIQADGPCVPSQIDPAKVIVLKDNHPARNSNRNCMAAGVKNGTVPMNLQQLRPQPAVPRPLQNIAHQFHRQQTFMQDGSVLSISGSAHPHRVEPPMFQIQTKKKPTYV